MHLQSFGRGDHFEYLVGTWRGQMDDSGHDASDPASFVTV